MRLVVVRWGCLFCLVFMMIEELAMINQQRHNLGAPDPEAKTSPIMEETDEKFEELAQASKEKCPISRLYAGGTAAVELKAELL